MDFIDPGEPIADLLDPEAAAAYEHDVTRTLSESEWQLEFPIGNVLARAAWVESSAYRASAEYSYFVGVLDRTPMSTWTREIVLDSRTVHLAIWGRILGAFVSGSRPDADELSEAFSGLLL